MKIYEAPIGTRIIFGAKADTDIIWRKVSDNQDFFAETPCGAKSFDSIEIESTSRARRNYGNNFFPHSNIFQYLNARGGNWYVPSHTCDSEPYYSYEDGFLTDFTPQEIELIVPQEITVSVPLGSRKEFGRQFKMTCAVSLPCAMQCGVEIDSAIDIEGEIMPGISDFIGQYRFVSVMTRTGVVDAGHIIEVNRNGGDKIPAYKTSEVHPMIRINGDATISDQPDANGFRYLTNGYGEFMDDFLKIID